MIRCWILNSMNKDLFEGFIYVTAAKDLWDEISERYGQSNAPFIYQLRRRLGNLTQGDSSIAEYYMKLKKIWDELQVLEGMPQCSFGKIVQCKCEIIKKIL